ncbi:DUF5716 family protein [Clostridium boliviensis]|uniref:DUF5716 family protein n=1 Tax=Clostridium boliviensis TaxID=318465 RepID=A0ABU4GN12_9CLOT|nr:DUF5716 family protein [Clostridium boliviensis]MDW2799016.1 DUF5716 family protein [Clostridium boliviensis]
MDGLIIGLDLCDAYTRICCHDRDKSWSIPTVICKKKDEEAWYIGEEAYAYTLVGEGIIVDKLIKMVRKDGTATLGGTKYEGLDLLKLFLKKIIKLPMEEFFCEEIKQLVITMQKVDTKLMDALMYCADALGIDRERVHIISHTESFVYYVLSQKKEVWGNQVGVFDLSEDSFHYHELKVQRGLRKMMVVAEHEALEESFNLDILDTPSGGKLADKILCSCVDRLMQKKLFSSVFLTGKGFERHDWAKDSMKMLCSRRKVYMEPELFARGAAFKGMDYLQDNSAYPFICICEGHLHSTISLRVLHKERESQLIVAAAGDSWYEAKSSVDLIVDKQDYVEFLVTPMDPKQKRLVKIPLEGFPNRPDRTTRLGISFGFLDEKTMAVVLKDKGFGELFPATDAVIRQEVML